MTQRQKIIVTIDTVDEKFRVTANFEDGRKLIKTVNSESEAWIEFYKIQDVIKFYGGKSLEDLEYLI